MSNHKTDEIGKVIRELYDRLLAGPIDDKERGEIYNTCFRLKNKYKGSSRILMGCGHIEYILGCHEENQKHIQQGQAAFHEGLDLQRKKRRR